MKKSCHSNSIIEFFVITLQEHFLQNRHCRYARTLQRPKAQIKAVELYEPVKFSSQVLMKL